MKTPTELLKEKITESFSLSLTKLFLNEDFTRELYQSLTSELLNSLNKTLTPKPVEKENPTTTQASLPTTSPTPPKTPPTRITKGIQSTLLRHCATGKTTLEALHYATHIPKEKIRNALYNRELFTFDGWTVTLTQKGTELASFFLARPDLTIYPAALSLNRKKKGT